MAILWCDGFDHYGVSPNGGRDAMLSMGWLEMRIEGSGQNQSRMQVSSSQARTGSCSLQMFGTTSNITSATSRIWASRTMPPYEGGIAFSVYIPSFNWTQSYTRSGHMPGLRFMTVDGMTVFRIVVNNDGSITLTTGAGTSSQTDPISYGTIIATSVQILASELFQHIEVGYRIDETVPENGNVQVRINGVVVISELLDLGITPIALVRIGDTNVSTQSFVQDIVNAQLFFDDIICWDRSGSFNNDFLGPFQRVHTLFPNEDTSQADWVLSTGSEGWEILNKPSVDDSTYLEAENQGDISDFALENLPENISAVAGIYAIARMSLVEGTSGFKIRFISDEEIAESDEQLVLSSGYAGYAAVFEIDPATGAPWTKSAVDEVKLGLNRST